MDVHKIFEMNGTDGELAPAASARLTLEAKQLALTAHAPSAHVSLTLNFLHIEPSTQSERIAQTAKHGP